MEILRSIQTGNPLIDAILFSILTFFVSRFLNNNVLHDLKSYLSFFTNKTIIDYTIERQQVTGTVEKYNGEDKVLQEKNPLYYALAWYLRKAQCTQGHAQSYKVIINRYNKNNIGGNLLDSDDDDDDEQEGADFHNECILVPTAKITILYDYITIKGKYEHQEDDKGKEIKDSFVLSVKEEHASKMTSFFQTIIDQHTKHVNILTKGQKIYSLNTDFYSTRDNQYWSNANFLSHTILNNVILKNNKQKILLKDIQTFIKSRDLYHKHGKVWKRGYIFYGPPGTGKTSLVKGIATITKYNIYNVKLSRFQSDEKMDSLLRQIPSKSIVLFEDVDCMGNLAHKRKSDVDDDEEPEGNKGNIPALKVKAERNENSELDNNTVKVEMTEAKVEKPTLNTLLNFIDGINSPEGIIVVMTTNHMEKLDPALLRDGRIDLRLHLSLCDRQQIVDLANNFFNLNMETDDIQDIPDDILPPATVSRIMMDIAFKQKMGEIKNVVDIMHEIILELKNALKEIEETKY